MIFSIQRFILFFIFLLLAIFYVVFTYYFQKQEEQTSKVIYTTILNDIKEKAYSISKNIEKKEDILLFRAQIGNISANSPFVSNILVFDDNELLLTTDPKIKKLEKNSFIDNLETYNDKLTNLNYLSENINFYEQNKQKKLDLIYVIDKNYINSYFIKK